MPRKAIVISQWKHGVKLFLIILFTLLLTSCFHTKRKDGPPNFYVDETKVPNAIPKAEPLAKYGNMKSYRVFGKRYHVMKSAKNYNAVGVASWYGTQFHDQRTSSGERYNMLAMTAAHKSLPLPTYVEVTNLQNHRKIIVKVNDRGPFEQNRIIDLSYVAAKKLGMSGRGTALVRVKAINPLTYGHTMIASNQSSKRRATRNANNFVYLQVGAFHDRTQAEILKQRLAANFKTPVHIAKVSSTYRVQIGPFVDKQTVKTLSTKLRRMGLRSSRVYAG